MRYEVNQFGIVYGPYGCIGYAGTLQREDLEQVVKTCAGLFRWAKQWIVGRL